MIVLTAAVIRAPIPKIVEGSNKTFRENISNNEIKIGLNQISFSMNMLKLK